MNTKVHKQRDTIDLPRNLHHSANKWKEIHKMKLTIWFNYIKKNNISASRFKIKLTENIFEIYQMHFNQLKLIKWWATVSVNWIHNDCSDKAMTFNKNDNKLRALWLNDKLLIGNSCIFDETIPWTIIL